jgi:hypothetical protein
MDKLYRLFADYYNRRDFREFQNKISKETYESLANSYSNSHNEVRTVTDMCETLNGKSFDKLRFYSKKIHGTRSFVEFYNQDKPVTTEMADMAIISVATRGKKPVFEKISFVQNKKEDTVNNWKIDQDQLYLLRNFPTIAGKKGLFKKNYKNEIVFLNRSENLGTYGLFKSSGDMVLTNAKTVFGLQNENKISFNDLKHHIDTSNKQTSNYFPFFGFDHLFWEEMIYRMYKHFPKYGLPLFDLPFLNNNSNSINIYDFIRNWTLFNIGEVCMVDANIIDNDLFIITQVLLKEAGLGDIMNIEVEQNEFENNIVVLVAHLNLDDKE